MYTHNKNLFWSLDILFKVLPTNNVARRDVVCYNKCLSTNWCFPHSNFPGFCPHQLCEVSSPRSKTGVIEIVLFYLLIPHIRCTFSSQLLAWRPREVLPHTFVVSVLHCFLLCQMIGPSLCHNWCSLAIAKWRGVVLRAVPVVSRDHVTWEFILPCQ